MCYTSTSKSFSFASVTYVALATAGTCPACLATPLVTMIIFLCPRE